MRPCRLKTAVSNFHAFKKLSRFRELWRSLRFVAKLGTFSSHC